MENHPSGLKEALVKIICKGLFNLQVIITFKSLRTISEDLSKAGEVFES